LKPMAYKFLETVANGATDLDKHLELLRSQANQIHRVANAVGKKASVHSYACEKLIGYIAFTILNRLRLETNINPEKMHRLLNGSIKVFTYKTATTILADAINSKTGSFTGQSGFYTQMLKMGFISEKRNYDVHGYLNENGSTVELTVNLDWLFGWSFLLKDSNGSSMTKIYNSLCKTGQRENAAVDNFSQSYPRLLNATIVADKVVEGQTRALISPPARRAAAPPPEMGCEMPVDVVHFVENRRKQAMSEIFNAENYAAGRIRVSENRALLAHNPDDDKHIRLLILNLYRKCHRNEEPWIETDARIGDCIRLRAEYMKKKPAFYSYAAIMYFGCEMNAGTLFWYHETMLHRVARVQSEPIELKPVEKKVGFDYVEWLVSEGGNRHQVKRSIASSGKSKSNDCFSSPANRPDEWANWVNDCINFCKLRFERGFEPKSDRVSYAIDRIRRAQHPKMTAADLRKEQWLHGQNITFKAEMAARDAHKAAHDRGDAPEKLLPNEKMFWTMAKVLAIVKKWHKGFNLSELDAQELANRANDREKEFSPENMSFWLDGIKKVGFVKPTVNNINAVVGWNEARVAMVMKAFFYPKVLDRAAMLRMIDYGEGSNCDAEGMKKRIQMLIDKGV
jgi:hypothetical protein